MAKRNVLGRGLSALIPDGPETAEAPPEQAQEIREVDVIPAADQGPGAPAAKVFSCPVSSIRAGAHQARKNFDASTLGELAESIREKGILQPLLVRKHGEGYELIAGERRLRAAVLAGLKEVPVIVRNEGDTEVHELSLIENLQRADLNPVEEAEAYRVLLEDHGYSQKDLARKLGKDRSTVANTVRLLRLPGEIQEDLGAGRISAGHARALLALPDAELQLEIRDRILTDGLSVRQAEALVTRLTGGDQKEKKAPRGKQPLGPFPYNYVLDDLRRRLSTKVSAAGDANRGKIEIHYFNAEDLKRIVEIIVK